MPGKKLAGRNITRLKTAHGVIADMMAEAGYGCDGEPLAEAVAIAAPTAADQARAAELVEAILMQGDSVDAKREALRQAVRDSIKTKVRDPLAAPDAYVYVYIRDLFDTHAVYCTGYDGEGMYQIAYTADMAQDPPVITLGEPVEVEIAYVPKAPAALGESDVQEAALVEAFVPLLEKAVRPDGTIPIKVIRPGWGSSGYYPADVLERDGAKAFPAGTKMYWNHPTAEEAAARPERDLRDLAAVTTSPAQWMANGPKGPGLYANARVMEAYKGSVDDMGGDIGVSIRAQGKARKGEAEGRKGPIIEAITAGQSIDFVTEPGAGGEILQLFEAARGRNGGASPTSKENGKMPLSEEEAKALQESNTKLQERLDALTKTAERLTEANLLLEARGVVERRLAPVQLHQLTRTRLTESLVAAAPVKDGQLDRAAFEKQIDEAAKAELQYLQETTGVGRVRLGGGNDPLAEGGKAPTLEESQKKLANAFEAIGLSEKAAGVAAEGR
jgi:hypothetical protein